LEGPFTRSQVAIILTGIMLEVFIGSISQMIVATAMPRIITDLGGFEKYTWVITIYMITSATVMPIAGKLSDMFGRKWLYVSGITIYITFSTLCGLSNSMAQLITFRGFQGLGFGTMMTLGMIIMADVFSPAERGKYLGFISAVFGISSIIGPTLGGYLTDFFSWRYCFFFNIPFGVIIIVLFVIFFPQIKSRGTHHRVDYPGIVTLTLLILSLMLSLSWGGRTFEWKSFTIISMMIFAVIMLLLFIKFEAASKDPVIPLDIFKNDIVAVSLVCVFIHGVSFFTCLTFTPLFLQGVMGMSAMKSGNLLSPMLLGSVTGSLLSGQALSRAGGHYKIQAWAGFLLIGIGFFLLSRMNPDTPGSIAVRNMVIVGLGNGIIMPLHMIAVQNSVPYSILGSVTASINLVRSLGGIFALAVYGSMMSNVFFSRFYGNLLPEARSALGEEKITSIARNPQALVNPEAQQSLREMFSAIDNQGMILFNKMVDVLQDSLSSAITRIFLFSLFAVSFALVLNFFLREIPLRKTVKENPSF